MPLNKTLDLWSNDDPVFSFAKGRTRIVFLHCNHHSIADYRFKQTAYPWVFLPTLLISDWSQHWLFLPKGWVLWRANVSYRCISSHRFCFPTQFCFLPNHQDQYVFSGHRRPRWPLISATTHMGKSRVTVSLWDHMSDLLQLHHNTKTSVSGHKMSESPAAAHDRDDKQPKGFSLTQNSVFLYLISVKSVSDFSVSVFLPSLCHLHPPPHPAIFLHSSSFCLIYLFFWYISSDFLCFFYSWSLFCLSNCLPLTCSPLVSVILFPVWSISLLLCFFFYYFVLLSIPSASIFIICLSWYPSLYLFFILSGCLPASLYFSLCPFSLPPWFPWVLRDFRKERSQIKAQDQLDMQND